MRPPPGAVRSRTLRCGRSVDPEPSRASGRHGPRQLPGAGAANTVKVAVFTTSYPRHEGDLAGRFVFAVVRRLRGRGVERGVVSCGDFGLPGSGGRGLVGSLKRRPWLSP